MTEFVLDASVTLAWFIEDQATEYTDAVPATLGNECTAVVPDELWRLEIQNAFLKLYRLKRWNEEKVRRGLAVFDRLAVESVPIRLLADPGFELALRHQLSSYDACYLALAKQRAVPLATTDKGLSQACREAHVETFGVG